MALPVAGSYLRVVKKPQFPWIIAIVLIVGLAAGGALGLILAAAGLFIAYLVSLRLHPRMSREFAGIVLAIMFT